MSSMAQLEGILSQQPTSIVSVKIGYSCDTATGNQSTNAPSIQQAAAIQGIIASNCDTDLVCLCSNNGFLTPIEGAIETQCSPLDGESKCR